MKAGRKIAHRGLIAGWIALVGFGAASAASGPAASRPQVRYRVVARAVGEAPMINDGVAVWALAQKQPRVDRTLLYASPLHPWHPRVVARSKIGTRMVELRISRRWFAWVELSNYTAGGWSVWAESRGSLHPVRIDSSAREGNAPGELLRSFIALYDSTLVWAYATCPHACRTSWRSDVASIDLRTGLREVLSSTKRYGCTNTTPALSATLLVWAQEGTCAPHAGSDIYAYIRHSGRVERLTYDGNAEEPSTNGSFLAWQRAPGRWRGGGIVLRDIQSGSTRVLDRSHSSQLVVARRGVGWYRYDMNVVRAYDFRLRRRYNLFPSPMSTWAVLALNRASDGDTISWVANASIETARGKAKDEGAIFWVSLP